MDAMLRILSLLLSAYTMLHGMYQSLPASAASAEPYLILVNRTHTLPREYVPEVVLADVPPNKEQNRSHLQLVPEAADALEGMFRDAKKDGHTLYGVSGYRSYASQASIYNRRLEQAGAAHVEKYIAKPGTSEHQTGLTMDVLGASTLNDGLEETFADSPEGQWVAQNAHRFGFIIRYPLGAEEITGYAWEPWHLRYVGTEHAKIIFEKNITLEEYLVQLRITELEQLIENGGLAASETP